MATIGAEVALWLTRLHRICPLTGRQAPMPIAVVVEQDLRTADAGEVTEPDGMATIEQVAEARALAHQAPRNLSVGVVA
jgi:hypothetical protein